MENGKIHTLIGKATCLLKWMMKSFLVHVTSLSKPARAK